MAGTLSRLPRFSLTNGLFLQIEARHCPQEARQSSLVAVVLQYRGADPGAAPLKKRISTILDDHEYPDFEVDDYEDLLSHNTDDESEGDDYEAHARRFLV